MLTLEILTTTTVGLLAGALLTEARVLVPYWQKMDPERFSQLHSTMASTLFAFFAPVTVAGTLLPIVTAATAWSSGESNRWLWLASAAAGVSLLVFYFAFFRGANRAFAEGRPPEQTARLLGRWARLHHARTVVALAGFVTATFALV